MKKYWYIMLFWVEYIITCYIVCPTNMFMINSGCDSYITVEKNDSSFIYNIYPCKSHIQCRINCTGPATDHVIKGEFCKYEKGSKQHHYVEDNYTYDTDVISMTHWQSYFTYNSNDNTMGLYEYVPVGNEWYWKYTQLEKFSTFEQIFDPRYGYFLYTLIFIIITVIFIFA